MRLPAPSRTPEPATPAPPIRRAQVPTHPKVLLATTNPGKVREYRELLRGFPFDIVTLEDAAVFTPVDETGATIHENAVLKACEYAKMTGMLTIADDSGLEV